jgi:hypothetical protein
MGYKVAIWRDIAEAPFNKAGATSPAQFLMGNAPYPGYAIAVNRLIKGLREYDQEAQWFVCAGDDTLPDPHKLAATIAAECSEHFGGTFGICQPTGDRWHEGVGGFSNAPIDRVCGSPWMGREFCKRMYQGKGPLFEGYTHMFVDEELQEVATKLGVLWQRRDLTHFHKHWGRGETDKSIVTDPKIPEHLVKWNTPEHWKESKALFESRKAAGFPGSEPL